MVGWCMNDELVTVRRAEDHCPGMCLEGLGKATQPVRIVSVRELPRADRSITRLFDRYNLSFGQVKIG
jgi:hypothetical protein